LRKKIKVFIVDDHALMRRGLADLVNGEDDLTVCGEADEAPKALSGISKTAPDLVIADMSLRGSSGLELIKNVKVLRPDLPILVLSMHDENIYAQRVLRAGAKAYVMKQDAADRVLQAIRKILKGEIYVSERVGTQMLQQIVRGHSPAESSPVERLSDRELEVVQLIGRGRTTREIAGTLNVSIKTIESHRAHLKEKLDLRNATELVQFCVQWVEQENAVKH